MQDVDLIYLAVALRSEPKLAFDLPVRQLAVSRRLTRSLHQSL